LLFLNLLLDRLPPGQQFQEGFFVHFQQFCRSGFWHEVSFLKARPFVQTIVFQPANLSLTGELKFEIKFEL